MPYLHLQRLAFTYKLMACLSFIPMTTTMYFILNNGSFTFGTSIATMLSVLFFIVCLKRHAVYEQKKIDFNYKYYLDNE
jgi:hypothetical protein